MKRQVLLSVLAAVVLLAASTTAQAGLFGRLHTIRGCAPCEPVCEQPCEPAACQPCEAAACEPCEAACSPCDGCYKPFRPFGFLAGLKAKLSAKLHHGCAPCEAVCDVPACEPVCEEPCNPCDSCDSCGHHGPFLPFGGFFLNLKAKLAAHLTPCSACGCQPCEPVCEPCVQACDPCN